MRHGDAVLQRGTIEAPALGAIFAVTPAAGAPVVVAKVAARVVASVVTIAAAPAVAARAVVVSAAAIAEIPAQRPLHVNRRATAPWPKLGPLR
jgi:hypothetical protein